MKKWKCDACGKDIEIYDGYEPEFCCAGRWEDHCICGGRPINPLFCDECEIKIFGEQISLNITK